MKINRINDSTLNVDGQVLRYEASKNRKGEYHTRGLVLMIAWTPLSYNIEERVFETSTKEVIDVSVRQAVLQFLNQEQQTEAPFRG